MSSNSRQWVQIIQQILPRTWISWWRINQNGAIANAYTFNKNRSIKQVQTWITHSQVILSTNGWRNLKNGSIVRLLRKREKVAEKIHFQIPIISLLLPPEVSKSCWLVKLVCLRKKTKHKTVSKNYLLSRTFSATKRTKEIKNSVPIGF